MEELRLEWRLVESQMIHTHSRLCRRRRGSTRTDDAAVRGRPDTTASMSIFAMSNATTAALESSWKRGDEGSAATRSVNACQHGQEESLEPLGKLLTPDSFGVLQQSGCDDWLAAPQHPEVGESERAPQQQVRPGRMQPQAKIAVAIPGSWTISPRQQAKATNLWGTVLSILEIHGARLERCLRAIQQSLASPPHQTMPIFGGLVQ